MYCLQCGKEMKLLPALYHHSGKSWYGCEPCDIVIEERHCSVLGRSFGTNPCFLSYKEFVERIKKKENGKTSGPHGNDTEKQVFFYEHEFYVLSNFSSFAIWWKGKLWRTSEHAYHSEKFEDEKLKDQIRNACSAHDTLKIAEANKDKYRKDWKKIRLPMMKEILKTKVSQHPYVKKKLLETDNRELIEDSWRDSFWGWGPNKDGENHMGKLWMEVREEIK